MKNINIIIFICAIILLIYFLFFYQIIVLGVGIWQILMLLTFPIMILTFLFEVFNWLKTKSTIKLLINLVIVLATFLLIYVKLYYSQQKYYKTQIENINNKFHEAAPPIIHNDSLN